MVSSDNDEDKNDVEKISQHTRSRTNSIATSKRTSSTTSLNSEKPDVNELNDDSDDQAQQAHELESSSKGKIKGPLLFHYLKSAEQPFLLFILFVLFLVAQFFASAADYWVAYW